MKKTLNIVDYSSIIYLTITALLILFYFEDIDKPIFHLLARIGFIFVLFFSAYVRNKYDYGYINLVASLVPLLFLGYLYNETADFNHIFFDSLDPWISQVELNIFFFQPSVSFSETFSDFWFSELMNFGYFSYYFIIFISPVLFYFQKRELFERTLFILLTSFYFFYIFFIIFPVVGPQFYFEG
ncbi:MAG: hypothetical protein KAH10_06090, partial [Flavobacteriales bacterium]|nr:hypothetical protein [Flavobacteriales bacterium]